MCVSLKSVNNRLTRHPRSGKHGRLGRAIGTTNVTRSLVEKYKFYLIFKCVCADFHARPSKE